MRATYLLILCLITGGANAGSRTEGEPAAPKVVARLLEAAGTRESYTLASDCEQPRDYAPTLVNAR